MKKIALILVLLVAGMFLSSCTHFQFPIKSVSLHGSSHFRNFANTETGIVNVIGVYVELVGYDGKSFAWIGPGSQITDEDNIWFNSLRVPIVARVYKNELYSEIIGVWGKTLQTNSLRDAIYEIRSFYTQDGKTSSGPRDLGDANTSIRASIPKPRSGNDYHILMIGGCGDDIYLDVLGKTSKFSFGEILRQWYRVDNYSMSGSQTVYFTYRIVRGGKLLKVLRGNFTPNTCGDGPGGDVIILGPNGPIKL